MEFRIADTFTDSLARLSGDEQKAAKTTAFDLQLNPESPGLSFHKLEKAKDRNFWSVRVNKDVRLIVHKTQNNLLLCYVDHHDKAYAWAERRKLETHPKTGAAQLVEIRETVKEVVVPVYVQGDVNLQPTRTAPNKPLFADVSSDDLLSYGIPAEWIEDVKATTEDTLLALTDHLPAEAAEALLELATGGKPRVLPPIPGSPFDHPDAQRRFRVMTNVEELERALDFPWDRWTIFLHPEQRAVVKRNQSGPARVSGSAGTGKTIVALHRAVHLAKENADGRVLLATYSEPLANALAIRLRRLISNEPRLGERIDVAAIPAVGARLYRSLIRPLKLALRESVVQAIKEAVAKIEDSKFTMAFLISEWDQVVDAWQLRDWESYRDVTRLGRKTRLREDRRKALWAIFSEVQETLGKAGMVTEAGMFSELAAAVAKVNNRPYDFVVVDEAQDISVQQLRFFAALGADRTNGLFFAGDLGQRIFQQAFSWKALGVDVRGRATTLRVNYRTSHQIRVQADRLLESEISDPDGNTETRGDAVSVFNGMTPTIKTFSDELAEERAVAAWLTERSKDGVAAHEIGIFVRSDAQIPRARSGLEAAGIPFKVLDERVEAISGYASVGTMHLAKGLEFRAVIVMACDDEVIPLQARIDTVGEDSDLKEVYDTERQLLYVACTRARDFLMVSGVEPASEFLDDLVKTPS